MNNEAAKSIEQSIENAKRIINIGRDLYVEEARDLLNDICNIISQKGGVSKLLHVNSTIANELDQTLQNVNYFSGKIENILNELEQKENELYSNWVLNAERQYLSFESKVNEIKDKINNISKFNFHLIPAIQFSEIKVPYNWNYVFEIYEKLENMSEESKKRFFEFIDKIKE